MVVSAKKQFLSKTTKKLFFHQNTVYFEQEKWFDDNIVNTKIIYQQKDNDKMYSIMTHLFEMDKYFFCCTSFSPQLSKFQVRLLLVKKLRAGSFFRFLRNKINFCVQGDNSIPNAFFAQNPNMLSEFFNSQQITSCGLVKTAILGCQLPGQPRTTKRQRSNTIFSRTNEKCLCNVSFGSDGESN